MNTTAKHRWGRYSLRTLLVLVMIASAGFGWLGVKVRQAQRQKEAVEAISKLYGDVWYDYEFGLSDDVNDAATPPGPAWLRKLLGQDFFANVYSVRLDGAVTEAQLIPLEGLSQLTDLYFGNSQLTDAALARLQRLTHLKRLQTFHCTQVTDAGIVHLRGLSELKWLGLCGAQVTDAGLLHLRGLTQLQVLDLNKSQITDTGLMHLQGLSELEWLDLGDTQITDAGLPHLQRLTKLDHLILEGTQVTDAGCRELARFLPNLKIYR